MRRLMLFLLIGALGVLRAQGPYTLNYDLSEFQFTTKDGYDRISGKGMFSTTDTGAPELPVHTLRFIIPPDRNADSIIILNKTLTQIPGEYNIYPAQPPVPITDMPESQTFVPPDSAIYSKDALYPGKVVEITHRGVFDGARIVEVSVYPIQYNPKTKSLYLMSQIEIDFSLSSGISPLRPKIRTEEAQKIYNGFLSNMVYNKEEISSYYTPPQLVKPEYLYENGYPEVVIVTTSELAPSFQPFADYLTQKGMPTLISTTDWIYANYEGFWDFTSEGYSFDTARDNAAKIKQYLMTLYLNEGLTYAILAGSDDDSFPFRYCWAKPGNDSIQYVIPSDLYFQDFTGNWNVDNDTCYGEYGEDDPDAYPEIFIGRVPCKTPDEAKSWVAKRLVYEKNPENRNLMLDIVWHGQSSVTDADQHFVNAQDRAQNIVNSTGIPFVHHEVRDFPSNPSDHRLVDTLSMGYGLVFIDSHGHTGMWVTSDSWQDFFYAGPDLDGYPSLDELHNTGKYYVVYQTSCDVAAFDWTPYGPTHLPSVAEGFTCKWRDTIPGIEDSFPALGAVAFLGNTRNGWDGQSFTLRDSFLTQLLFTPASDSNEYRLGPAESFARLMVDWEWYGRYLCYSHNLFGSPEMQVWTNIPQEMIVNHPRAIPYNIPVDFVIDVTDKNTGESIEGATVVLYKKGDTLPGIYKTAVTDASGRAVFSDFKAPSTGKMKITVTRHNYIPYQKDVDILNLGPYVWKTDKWDATGDNNARRIVFDPENNTIYAAFTKSNGIYFTYSSDYGNTWESPLFVSSCKYPALSVDKKGKIHMVYTDYNESEQNNILAYREYDPATSRWIAHTKLFTTHGTDLLWIGPPSCALIDTLLYITWESPFSAQEALSSSPQPIPIEGTRVYLGKLNLNTREFSYEIADAVISPPFPVLPDSLYAITRSPSIQAKDTGHILIFWDVHPKYYSGTKYKLRVCEKNAGHWTWLDFGYGKSPHVDLSQDKFRVVYVGDDGNIYYTERWIDATYWRLPINLSETDEVCDNPVIFSDYVAWTQYGRDYSDIFLREYDPIHGWQRPENLTNINLLYSKYPQISYGGGGPSGSYLHILFTEGNFYYQWVRYMRRTYPWPIYEVSMNAGDSEPSPYTVHRDTFYRYGDAPYQSVDVAQDELVYRVSGLHSPHEKYYIRWQWYQKERDKIKLQFNIDNIFHHNRWVYSDSLLDITSHIPESCLKDGEIIIRVKVLNGPCAVLSGFQIYKEEVGSGGAQSTWNEEPKLTFGIRVLRSNIVSKNAVLEYSLPSKEKINLSIYNAAGRKIKTLRNGIFEKGVHRAKWDLKDARGRAVGKGIYFVVLKGEKAKRIQKMLIVK